MIVGLGMDLCAVIRISRLLDGPLGRKFRQRVFTDDEVEYCEQRTDPEARSRSFAARFAAKEALVKALGAPPGIKWREMEVLRGEGAPSFRLSGVAADEVKRKHAVVHLALTHDAGTSAAVVVLESS